MLELVLRIGFSLFVVFGLMWGLAKLAKRPLSGRGGAALSVLARQQLSRSSSVAVIRVVDRALVLGVTDGHISLLGEADLPALERQIAGPDNATRKPVGLDGTARRPVAGPVVAGGRLNGSVLSPAMWRQTVDFVRDRTARRR